MMPLTTCWLTTILATVSLIITSVHAATGVTQGTIIIKRGADPHSITSTFADPSILFSATDNNDNNDNEEEEATAATGCKLEGIIALQHPMSLKPDDKFFSTGQLQLKSIEMMVDEINTAGRCGVLVNGKHYGLELLTYGDDSSTDKIQAIVENGMIPYAQSAITSGEVAASYWLGPYSSGLTGKMSPYANATAAAAEGGVATTTSKNILVAGGAAATSVFKDYPTIFGTFPPTGMYLAQAIEALSKAGAKSAAGVWEDASFTRGVCAALPTLADQFGLIVQSMTQVASGPTAIDLDPVAQNLSLAEANPDVVVTCVYAAGCAEWIASLRRSKWSPRAQVFTVCIGMDSFVEAVGVNDAMYMSGISPWDPSLAMKDDIVGWSAAEFADLFFKNTARTSTYHSASAAASVGTLVQAIERANTFDVDTIANILATEEFTTLYGKVRFDTNGQSMAPSLYLQYDVNTTVQTVYPLDASSGELVYPMPTWDHRDCSFVSTCETGSTSTVVGVCQVDGSCKCNDDDAVSSGKGSDASCVIIPVEDQTYIGSALLAMGTVLFIVQTIFSLACAGWTWWQRKSRIVRAGQPIFLGLVGFGAFVMNLAIIPAGIQGKYRYLQDGTTGELTDVEDPDIGSVDAACMAVPWLFSMGFSIVFSALFAKIWRIKMVWKAAQAFIAKTVSARDVGLIIVGVLVIQAIVLTCWQVIDPMIWQREVIFDDANGYPLKSVGACESESGIRFYIPLVLIDGGMLVYALYLCFVTRKVSSDYQEGVWITASVISIIQILVLAIPILIITDNNNDAFYFVRAAVIFLMSATPTALIFLPKMHRLHFVKEAVPPIRSNISTHRAASVDTGTGRYPSNTPGQNVLGRTGSQDSGGRNRRATLEESNQPFSLAHGLSSSKAEGDKKSLICVSCGTVNDIPSKEGNAPKPEVRRTSNSFIEVISRRSGASNVDSTHEKQTSVVSGVSEHSNIDTAPEANGDKAKGCEVAPDVRKQRVLFNDDEKLKSLTKDGAPTGDSNDEDATSKEDKKCEDGPVVASNDGTASDVDGTSNGDKDVQELNEKSLNTSTESNDAGYKEFLNVINKESDNEPTSAGDDENV